MKDMEITYNKTVSEKRSIKLPYYTKYGQQYTKIINEKDCLIVSNYSFSKKIEKTILDHISLGGNSEYEVVTEQEFNDVFNQVLSELSGANAVSITEQIKELIQS